MCAERWVCRKLLGRRRLNQDLLDLWIFRITGDRLMAVERILFASVERADCRGPVIWDAPSLNQD